MKRAFIRGSLARQLIVPMAVAALGLIALALLGIYQVAQRKILRDLERSAEFVTTAMVSAAETVRIGEDLQRFVSTLAAEPQVKGLLLVARRDPVVIAGSRHDWLGRRVDQIPDASIQEVIQGGLAHDQSVAVFRGGGATYQLARRVLLVLPGDHTLLPTEAVALVQLDVAAIRAAAQRDLYWFALGSMLGVILLLSLLGRLLYRRVLTPLGGLRRQLEADTTGQGRLQPPRSRTHEIDLLVNSINTARQTREEHTETALRAAEALTRSEARLRAIFEGAPVGIVAATAAERRLVLANPAMARMFGTDLEALLQRPIGELHPDWARPQVEAGFARIAAGRFDPQIHPCERADGSVFYCAITPWPIQIEGRDHLLAFFNDVTTEHEAREALTMSQADLLNAQRLARLASWRYTPVTGLFTFSEQLPALLGLPPADLNLANLQRCLHPAELPLLEKNRLDALAGKVVEVEHRLMIGGRELWLLTHAEPMPASNGGVALIHGVTRDITHRKHTEFALQRTQRLESIGTLAGGVAHDLNNLLAPILMAAELIKKQTPTARQPCELIEKSTRRASGIVRQLLTFARGLGGERGPVQIRQEIREIETFIRSTFDRSIIIAVDCPGDLPLVMADPNQLHQVLLNLTINARDAMPTGGSLTIGVAAQPADRVPVEGGFGAPAQSREYLCITVTDTGCGIPADQIERIFDPFYTTKAPGKGTGLGLSTALGIMRGHEGFLRLQSRPGQGSAFEIWLPCIPGQSVPPRSAAVAPPRGDRDAVLVVDDEVSVREILTILLESWGFVVCQAVDGAAALSALAANPLIRLVITDINMPKLDGLGLVETLRQRHPSPPVIVMTGLHDEERINTLRSLGARAILSKPFTVDDLAQILQDWPRLPESPHRASLPPRGGEGIDRTGKSPRPVLS